MRLTTATIVFSLTFPITALAQSDEDVYTLYRNSPLDGSMRIHVASFDTAEGAGYNSENCNLAADLFSRQDGVLSRFWCEKGRYRR